MKIDLEELLENMQKGIPQGLLEDINKTTHKHALKATMGDFDMKEFYKDASRIWDAQGVKEEIRDEKLNEVYGVVDRTNHGMSVMEALEDYRYGLRKAEAEKYIEKTSENIEKPSFNFDELMKASRDMFKTSEEVDEVESLIDEIDEFRKKYHNKFKDANTFWEMLYDKIRETL